MIEHSPELTELAKALHSAQGAMKSAAKDGANPHFKSKYATLESVIEAAKPALQAAGLSFTQAPGMVADGRLSITTMVLHISGQWMRSTLHIPLAKSDPQGVGSAISYGKRYALMAVFGLPSEDDDAEAATDRNPPRALAAPRAVAQTPRQPTLAQDAREKAQEGTQAYSAWFAALSREDKAALVEGGHHAHNKTTAMSVDAGAAA